jgi:hypothetical protein
VAVQTVLSTESLGADAGRRVRSVVFASNGERLRREVTTESDRDEVEEGGKIFGHVETLLGGLYDLGSVDDSVSREISMVCQGVETGADSSLIG